MKATVDTASTDGGVHDRYEGYGYDWDVELMDELITTYGWLFKPLEPFDSFNNMSGFSEKDIARLDYCNEMLLEFLEEHADEYDDVSIIPDRKIIVHVSGELCEREGTTRQNIYQWMTPHVRLECLGVHQNDEWVHIDDYRNDLQDASQEGWEDGFAAAFERLSDGSD